MTVENTARLDCRTGSVDWGRVHQGEAVNPGDAFHINLDLNKVAMTAIAVGGGIAALLGALFIISMRK